MVWTLFDLDDRHDHFDQSVVRSADAGHVVDLGALHEGGLDLHREDVLPPLVIMSFLRSNNVEIPFVIGLQQVPGIEPAVLESVFRRHLRVLVVFLHHPLWW